MALSSDCMVDDWRGSRGNVPFPFIFNKMELPLWYAYASFGVLLVSSLLGYFVNYKQIILSADQCEYAITYSYKGTLIVKTFCQMAAVYYFPNGYLWWLILEFVFAFVASWRLNQTIRKRAPFCIPACRSDAK